MLLAYTNVYNFVRPSSRERKGSHSRSGEKGPWIRMKLRHVATIIHDTCQGPTSTIVNPLVSSWGNQLRSVSKFFQCLRPRKRISNVLWMMRFAFWSTAAWRQYPIDEKLGHEKLPVLYVFEMSCTNILRFHMGTVHKKSRFGCTWNGFIRSSYWCVLRREWLREWSISSLDITGFIIIPFLQQPIHSLLSTSKSYTIGIINQCIMSQRVPCPSWIILAHANCPREVSWRHSTEENCMFLAAREREEWRPVESLFFRKYPLVNWHITMENHHF